MKANHKKGFELKVSHKADVLNIELIKISSDE